MTPSRHINVAVCALLFLALIGGCAEQSGSQGKQGMKSQSSSMEQDKGGDRMIGDEKK